MTLLTYSEKLEFIDDMKHATVPFDTREAFEEAVFDDMSDREILAMQAKYRR